MTELIWFMETSEYFLPLGFFAFTHFIDARVHKHWAHANYNQSKWVRLIHRYQWEICFLVMSMLAISGIKVANKGEDYVGWGLGFYLAAFGLIIFLLTYAMKILSDEGKKWNAYVFYLSIFVYISYLVIELIFIRHIPSVLFKIRNITITRGYIIGVAFLFFLAIIFFVKRHVDFYTRLVILNPNDPNSLVKVYEHPQTRTRKRKEALNHLLKYYLDHQDYTNLKKWIKIGELDFPKHTAFLLTHLRIAPISTEH